MRIVLVGSDKIYAIENHFKKYFEEFGIEVSLFPAQSIFYDYYQQSILHKILFRTSLSRIQTKINKLFKKHVKDFNPEIVWVFKGMEITPASLKWVRDRGIRLVNYNPDNPFIFSGRGSGNRNITKSIELYELHFSYNYEVLAIFRNEFHVETEFLPFGFDLDGINLHEVESQNEVLRCCFLGNPDMERVGFIQELVSKGVSIDLYGNHWEDFINGPSINIFPAVYGLEFWKIMRKYRVQLNLMRRHNENSHNMRSFEIPAVGGIMLAPNTVEHKIFFSEGVDVFLFSNLDECVSQINRILALSAGEAEKIRTTARENSIIKGYSYRDRAKSVLKALKNLKSKYNDEQVVK